MIVMLTTAASTNKFLITSIYFGRQDCLFKRRKKKGKPLKTIPGQSFGDIKGSLWKNSN